MSLTYVADQVIQELRAKSKAKIYKRDPEAWFADVLDGYWWSKQKEIAWSVADPDKPQTMTIVKSCNGIGKTRIAADLATYYVSVFDPMETSIITTAPIFAQIRTGLFRYIADNYSIAAANKITLPGRFISDPALRVTRPDGTGLDKDVIQAKRPADNNLISSFQGIHDGIVVVLMDEAGGLPEDLYIGANAVTTNEHAKILAIGNPDSLHTAFHARFNEREKFQEWNPITISAYDSPNLTGETVHPDPEKNRRIKSHLVQRKWVEMMERQAHPSVVRAKVHGEFPENDETAFFTQYTLNRAYDTEIEPVEGSLRTLGVDISTSGVDWTTYYLNNGGKVRLVHKAQFEDDYMAKAHQVHKLALEHAVHEVRLDAAGTGEGVFSLLETQPQFKDAPYLLVGVKGSHSSPDVSQWANARAWHYDTFRRKMQTGEIDLDPEDTPLKDEMLRQPFEINTRGAIQIMPKVEMKKKGMTSPDFLDAAIYAAMDLEWLTGNPLNQLERGERVSVSPEDIVPVNRNWWQTPGGAF